MTGAMNNRRRWGTPAILAMTAALAVQQAAAQETEEEAESDVITVYGTTNPLPAFEYPGQVTIIDREAIEQRSASAISDVLRDVPGMEFTGGPRRTGEVPSIRGLSGENVLVLLDGARQSFISAHDGRFFLDPDLIAQAEVVRGPASSLYGSGALGGVLAFETVDADDLLGADETFGVRLKGGYQSVNEETSAGITAFTRQGGFDGLASFSLRQSGDIELGSGAELSSDDDIDTALLKAGYQFSPAFRAEASWQRFANSAIEPNNGQGTVTGGDVEKDITTDTYRLGLEFDPQSDLINASVTAYRSETEVEEFDETIPRTVNRVIETNGISLRNASRFEMAGQELTFTIGGDWFEDEQNGSDDQTMDGERGGVPDGGTEFLGVFAQLEASFEEPFGLPGELLVIPGVRYDEFSSDSSISPDKNEDDAVSPRFAASYGPVSWFRAFGSYSEGFRAPSVNELFLDGVHFPVPHPILFNPAGMPPSFTMVNNNFIPNADLKPEKASTTEFGIGVDFHDIASDGDRLQAKISTFESDVEDLINLSVNFAYDATCFSPPFFPCTAGTTNSANVDAATLEGIELEGRYDSDLFFARVSYSQIDGEDEATGADLGILTPDRFAVDTGFNLRDWNALVGTRIQVASDFDHYDSDGMGGTTLAESRDGYTVVDLYASWKPAFAEGLRIDAGIDNVFDEDYERVFEGVSEPATNFKIAASWQFTR
ncbi:TonB-dependent hemoglobin/transferrin/lactoferrin family receptor [Parvularcula marina]|nr:TonB-dependent hemoglobin/transferrin/lactoferrin family receptor [Parvularcula marina]